MSVTDSVELPQISKAQNSGPNVENADVYALVTTAQHEFVCVFESSDAFEDRLKQGLVHVMRLWELTESNATAADTVHKILEEQEVFRTDKWKIDPFTPLIKLVVPTARQHKANISRWAGSLKDAKRHNIGSDQLLAHFAEAGGPTNCAKREQKKRHGEGGKAKRTQTPEAAFTEAVEARKQRRQPIETLGGINIATDEHLVSVLVTKADNGWWPIAYIAETPATARRFLPELQSRHRTGAAR